MQVLSPLLDGSNSPGTAGQLLGSNGAVAAPTWRAGAAYDRLSALVIAETALVATDVITALGRSYTSPGGNTHALPQAVAGNAGQWVSIRVLPSATSLQQLTAPVSTVGGRTAGNFRLWAGESVDLQSDGVNWLVRSNARSPLSARYYLAATVTAALNTDTAVPVASKDYDLSGLMAYTGARPGGIVIPRAGLYQLVMKAMVQGVGGGGVSATMTLNAYVQKNQPTVSISTGVVAFMNTPIPQYQYGTATLTNRLQLAAGDYLHLGVTPLGAGVDCNSGAMGCYLELSEV